MLNSYSPYTEPYFPVDRRRPRGPTDGRTAMAVKAVWQKSLGDKKIHQKQIHTLSQTIIKFQKPTMLSSAAENPSQALVSLMATIYM